MSVIETGTDLVFRHFGWSVHSVTYRLEWAKAAKGNLLVFGTDDGDRRLPFPYLNCGPRSILAMLYSQESRQKAKGKRSCGLILADWQKKNKKTALKFSNLLVLQFAICMFRIAVNVLYILIRLFHDSIFSDSFLMTLFCLRRFSRSHSPLCHILMEFFTKVRRQLPWYGPCSMRAN